MRIDFTIMGNVCAKYRKNANMTQEEVAEQIGVSRSMICLFEGGYVKKMEIPVWYIMTFQIPESEITGWWNNGAVEED